MIRLSKILLKEAAAYEAPSAEELAVYYLMNLQVGTYVFGNKIITVTNNNEKSL